ncbi:ATP phosphoribosyltransferase regulatory subunit [Desulfonispora thiosulfatigenes DSM 11270]|uniref:ATP phosphoribosyltransferase regulatory subunit n=1 Tax=Desulfonispora thiosulfatigenes DSM 11270 TaxID=656914 RepID=A0A1W1V464_DESTI|nr:ATP phosphoribosyltransferase regulatory subunit [Desulfonispora thiosulfatigenes]SMB88070.1 ATP phosphoribosyltransferase regulatory subunit [Desulfonispora thiosulfatigenes DSM 11270]
MPLYFEKPRGTKDTLPDKMKKLNEITGSWVRLMGTWGYEEIQTPVIEFYETVGLFSKTKQDSFLKLLDGTGKTTILRSDYTTPIARLTASLHQKIEFPIRYMYHGKVYRNKGSNGVEEINQLGIELVGVDNLEGDAEVICLAVKSISNCTSKKFQISIGHSQFLQLLLKQVNCPDNVQKSLYNFLLEQNYVGYKSTVSELNIEDKYKTYLIDILKLRGSIEQITSAKDWFNSPEWQNIFAAFLGLWKILQEYQIEEYIGFDLSLVGNQNYYTGLIYNGYSEGNPAPICTGGRYDNLFESFERNAPATGFAINIDALVNVSELNMNEKKKTLIIYEEKNRLETIKIAEQMRSEGKIVIIIDKNKVTEKYKEEFAEVLFSE